MCEECTCWFVPSTCYRSVGSKMLLGVRARRAATRASGARCVASSAPKPRCTTPTSCARHASCTPGRYSHFNNTVLQSHACFVTCKLERDLGIKYQGCHLAWLSFISVVIGFHSFSELIKILKFSFGSVATFIVGRDRVDGSPALEDGV